ALKIQEGVYKVNPKTDIKIKTINPFKNVDKKVTGLWKIKTPEKLVKILTYTGREITLTPETKMKTLENGLIYWKKAADFTVNDYLAAARRIIYNGKRVNILALIGDDENIEVGVVKTFFKKTLEKLNNKNILENIKNQTISELDKAKHARTVESCDTVKIPLREFIKYSKNAGFSLNYITRYIREYY
ncbi:MAG: Hint domain-containing protein, partial [Candidatus Odinarchaeota archaeon]